ncbi:hypothetical protein [Streptomyces sp. PvR034]|uniref:hypothetical protein n=1 Tax=Streptomyces sp. PvR034 TaxID=3156401 RepID=UPI00339A1EED
METLSARVIVNLTKYPRGEPETSWVISLDSLGISVEEAMAELQTLTWMAGKQYPVMSSLNSRLGIHNWGASSSFVEFVLDMSAGGLGGLSATAIDTAVRDLFSRFRSRARSDEWGALISEEDALSVARSRISTQYSVAVEDLAVQRAEADASDQSHSFGFSHPDGRSFGAVVGIVKDSPTCMRIWREGPESAA